MNWSGRLLLAAWVVGLGLVRIGGAETNGLSSGDFERIRAAGKAASSLILTEAERVRALESFVELLRIKGPSREEKAIVDELRRRLVPLGAVEKWTAASNAPQNLILEIAATGAFSNRPGLLLNAHIDTIPVSDPERMAFDAESGDFFHRDEGVRGKPSSFGGDDRTSVAAIAEAVGVLTERFWSKGVAHRRIVLLFTAQEERGLLGAKYLARERPEVFENLDISLAMDGPIELESKYPEDSFVLVVSKTNEVVEPYQRMIGLVENYCGRVGKKFGRTDVGLGSGDFAAFPKEAKSGLHIRSTVRGWHGQERVKAQDQIAHTDLLCFLVLGWDHKLPEKITPEALVGGSSAKN